MKDKEKEPVTVEVLRSLQAKLKSFDQNWATTISKSMGITGNSLYAIVGGSTKNQIDRMNFVVHAELYLKKLTAKKRKAQEALKRINANY